MHEERKRREANNYRIKEEGKKRRKLSESKNGKKAAYKEKSEN